LLYPSSSAVHLRPTIAESIVPNVPIVSSAKMIIAGGKPRFDNAE
jgi:hypothetical protein